MGILDSDLRKRFLQMPDLTINLCIDMCRAYEATENRMRYMDGSSQYDVYSVKHTRSLAHSTKGKMRGYQPRKQVKCRFCVKTHEMTKEACSACVNYASIAIAVTISPSHARRKGGYMSWTLNVNMITHLSY